MLTRDLRCVLLFATYQARYAKQILLSQQNASITWGFHTALNILFLWAARNTLREDFLTNLQIFVLRKERMHGQIATTLLIVQLQQERKAFCVYYLSFSIMSSGRLSRTFSFKRKYITLTERESKAV